MVKRMEMPDGKVKEAAVKMPPNSMKTKFLVLLLQVFGIWVLKGQINDYLKDDSKVIVILGCNINNINAITNINDYGDGRIEGTAL